ncbi:MAG: DNA adenine methylase [Candidatus Caldarchaeum sp.]
MKLGSYISLTELVRNMYRRDFTAVPPIKWYGGKHFMLKTILRMIPRHKTYVEVFGGAAHLLFAKEPSMVEVYNDSNGDLVNLYRVLQNPEMFLKFFQKAALTLDSREMFDEAVARLGVDDPVERAVAFYITVRQSFNACMSKWSYEITSRRADYMNRVFVLPFIHMRLRHVQIEHGDFEDVIKRYDTGETFMFVDPPYIASQVVKGHPYELMPDADHERLVDVLLGVKGKALLTGYANPIYVRLEENGWYTMDVERTAAARPAKGAGSRGSQMERIWWNYEL